VTWPGLGGQQVAPVNAPAGQATPIGVTPGTTGLVIARQVIIIGSGGQLLVYSPTAAAGNLIASIAGAAGTDTYGNKYLAGFTTYGGTDAMQMETGDITFYTGSLAAGWTQSAQIFLNTGVIELITTGGVITANNTLDNGSGGATFNGAVAVNSLTIGGSSNTQTAHLSNSGISGTSGAASAGTAHTHSAGGYAVSNDSHFHPL
jgi:hypothetical protein